MKGRKPTPTNLKILRGNPGRRPINEAEPQFLEGDLEVPEEFLGSKYEDAKAEWLRIAPQLRQAGVYKKIDRTALVAYCVTYNTWKTAIAKLNETGLLVTQNGQFFRNPYLRIAEDAMTSMRSFLADFGMTPIARTRLKVGETAPAVDAFEEYLSSGKR